MATPKDKLYNALFVIGALALIFGTVNILNKTNTCPENFIYFKNDKCIGMNETALVWVNSTLENDMNNIYFFVLVISIGSLCVIMSCCGCWCENKVDKENKVDNSSNTVSIV